MPRDRPTRLSAIRRELARYASAAYRLLTDGSYRSAVMLRLKKPKNLFQICNVTRPDRYPVLFRVARQELGGGPDQRLLSFGCATGEEVFSLRKYFPHAWIKGIDINKGNIAACRRQLALTPDPKMSFEQKDSVEGEPPASFDAIFCLAVFRHGHLTDERYQRCDSLIRFADFSRLVEEIAARIKPGGLLAIIHANFRFRDTPTAEGFELMHQLNLRQPGRTITPIFDRDNRRTDEFNCGDVLFRKKGNGRNDLE